MVALYPNPGTSSAFTSAVDEPVEDDEIEATENKSESSGR